MNDNTVMTNASMVPTAVSADTLAARLGPWAGREGERVRIKVVVAAEQDGLVGETGVLHRFDRGDSRLTFLVNVDSGPQQGPVWVYDIEPYEQSLPGWPEEVSPTVLAETLEERLGDAPAAGPEAKVKIVQAAYEHDAHVVGEEATLQSIDRSDPRQTFRVAVHGKGPFWVHRVAKIDDTQSEPEDPKDVALRAAEERASAAVADSMALRNQLERLKEEVRDVAIRVAEEQGWCDDGLNGVLEELGLEPKQGPEYEIEVMVRYTMRARPAVGFEGSVTSGWIQSSLQHDEGSMEMDGDWDDWEVSGARIVSVEYEEA